NLRSSGTRSTSPGCRRSHRPPGRWACGSTAQWCSSALPLARNDESERGASPEPRLQLYAAVQHLGEAAADGKPEAGASVLAGDRVVRLAEILEHLVLILRRDPDPRVLDGDVHLAPPLVLSHHHLHLAVGRELDGVGEQVEDDLLHLLPV